VISVLNEDYSWEKPPDWINVVEAYTRLADDKAKKTDLPPKLDKINRDLGKQFTVALASIEKAKTEISGVDIAAIHMRDVLQQIWGGLTLLARKKNSKRNRNLEFKKTDDRIRIAEILGEDDSKKKKLVLLLDNMYALHLDLSDTDLTKNPLSNNLIRMNELFEKWILQIDDLVNILRI
jgi:hypothetical protein